MKNGAGKLRYSTRDSHFDKVGSVRRSFYIPDGTRVQVLCQEERITLQRCIKAHKLAMSRKYTVVWNNRYKYTPGSDKTLKHKLAPNSTVTLVKFGKSNNRGNWYKRWYNKSVGKAWRFIKQAFPVHKKRYWRVAVVDADGKISQVECPKCNGTGTKKHKLFKNKDCKKCAGTGKATQLFTVNEEELEHVGKEDINQVRDNSNNWKKFEVLGNVNKCNLTELGIGRTRKSIQDSDVPGYGELYDHCISCVGYIRFYKCNYCDAKKQP